MEPSPRRNGICAAYAGRRGSVLMETILVVPLFLMLLGGMFVLGDLVMGKLLQLDLDRAVAWRATDRFGPDAFVNDAFKHAVGRDGVDKPPALHGYNDDNGSVRSGNSWVEFRFGRSDVQVDAPWWTAYLDVQNVMVGDEDRFQSSFKLDSVDDKFLTGARSFVFRRRAQSNRSVRSGAAGALPWVEIALESMAGSAVPVRAEPAASSMMEAYDRIPHAIDVSGDPGP